MKDRADVPTASYSGRNSMAEPSGLSLFLSAETKIVPTRKLRVERDLLGPAAIYREIPGKVSQQSSSQHC